MAPLWEQARILADQLTGENPEASFRGLKLSTKLKIMGVDLAVMGDKDPQTDADELVHYSEPTRGVYKKLIIRDGRLAGAILLGDGLTSPTCCKPSTGVTSCQATEPACCSPERADCTR